MSPTLDIERAALASGALLVAGIDEVGRGALAGPVTVGVVVVGMQTYDPPAGLRDSKLLTPLARERLVPAVQSWALASAIGSATNTEIDRVGIIGALRLATHRALAALRKTTIPSVEPGRNHFPSVEERGSASRNHGVPSVEPRRNHGTSLFPDLIILDGNHDWLSGPSRIPKVIMQVKGDQHCASIAAASVLAKQHRDAHMVNLAPRYPQYSLNSNKGYGSAEHLAALEQFGPAKCHRRSWDLPGKDKQKDN